MGGVKNKGGASGSGGGVRLEHSGVNVTSVVRKTKMICKMRANYLVKCALGQ